MQAAGGADPLTPRRGAAIWVLAIASFVLAVDQLTKVRAVSSLQPGVPSHAFGPVWWTLQRNPGAAFSFLTRVPWLFTVIAIAIVAVILVRLRSFSGGLQGIAVGLVLGGALGNLADRLFRAPGPFRGHVVDFVDLRWWPVFNVADSCIVVGAALLILASWRRDVRERREREAAAREGDARDPSPPEPRDA